MTVATERKTLSSLELFYEEVLYDYSLQEQLKVAATSQENLIKMAIKLGSERGYHFDANELRKYLEQEISGETITLTKVDQIQMVSSDSGSINY